MRPVYINGRFLSQKRSGTQRFAEEIVKSMDRLLAASGSTRRRFVLMAEATSARDLHLERIETRKIGTRVGHLWEQADFYRAARSGVGLDLVNSAPILHRRQIVTIHDTSIWDRPELFSKQYVRFHRMLRPLFIRGAKKIVTVSEYSKARLVERLGVAPERIAVVPNGCDHITRSPLDENVLDRHGLKPQGYVLAVGNAAPNKNIAAAIRAFEAADLPDLKMVLVGSADARVFGPISLPEGGRYVRIAATDPELRSLYRNASVFVFPSLYEGFGIPPLEAMTSGCPVITSDNAAIPETVGDAAVRLDPADTRAFAAAMETLCRDVAIRDLYVARGRERAAAFSWDASGARILRLIEEVEEA